MYSPTRNHIFAQATLRPELGSSPECEQSLLEAKSLKLAVITSRLTTSSDESTHHNRTNAPSIPYRQLSKRCRRGYRVDRGTDFQMRLGDDGLIEMALNEYDLAQTWFARSEFR